MGLILGSFTAAQATTYRWSWSGATPVSHAGGTINEVHAEFDSAAQRLKYEVKFSARPGSTSKPDGYWMAINNGPNPKGVAGELALFYFDASASAPVLTAYGYNGFNGNSSYYDGSPASGTQAPDRLASSKLSTSWINNLSVVNSGSYRTMRFDINVGGINSHTPIYPDSDPWKGAQFDNMLGLWMHPVDSLTTAYTNGYLSNWSHGYEGWLDLTGEHTEVVPEPATMAVLGMGAVALMRRRRK